MKEKVSNKKSYTLGNPSEEVGKFLLNASEILKKLPVVTKKTPKYIKSKSKKS